MHFIGEHAGQKLIQRQTPIYSPATGEKIDTKPTIWLKLDRGKAPEWAVQIAKEHFRFAMRPTAGSIGGADIAVEQWCVYVDTEEWAESHRYGPEIRELADIILGGSPDLMKVEPPVLRPPWPKYDTLTVQGRRTAQAVAEKQLETAAEIGVSVDELIAYEAATLKRDDVLAVYEQALAAAQPEDLPESVLIEA